MAIRHALQTARDRRTVLAMGDPVPVELDGVWASYEHAAGRAAPKAKVIHRLMDVDLQLEPGQLCAVLGPNGAGKSTLVRVIAGILAPDRGTVRIFGCDARALDRQAIAQQVAVVAQRNEVALGFTVRDVVEMGRAPHQGAWQRRTKDDVRAAERAIEICALEALAHRPVAALSGGEQKRVHIARSLAQEAPVLLLDEAAAHLDVRHGIALYELIHQEVRARDLACVAVMHDLNAAAQHADRVVLLKDGRVEADGAVDEVMTAVQLSRTFDAEIHTGTTAEHGQRYFLPVSASRPKPGERSCSPARRDGQKPQRIRRP